MNRPALIARFPKPFWWRPDPGAAWPDDWPVVPAIAAEKYPHLAADLALWTRELEQPYRLLDHRAQLFQQRHWRQRTTLILGGLLATTLGAVHASLGGGDQYLATGQATVTALLTGVAAWAGSSRTQERYLSSRLQAETMKTEFFLYLARTSDYAGEDGLRVLRTRLEDLSDVEAGS